MDIKTVAGTVATVDEGIMKFLPFISLAIGFIPGGAAAKPFMPLVAEVLAALDNAAKSVAAGNNGAAIEDVITAVKNHLTAGQPNAPALAPDPQASTAG